MSIYFCSSKVVFWDAQVVEDIRLSADLRFAYRKNDAKCGHKKNHNMSLVQATREKWM